MRRNSFRCIAVKDEVSLFALWFSYCSDALLTTSEQVSAMVLSHRLWGPSWSSDSRQKTFELHQPGIWPISRTVDIDDDGADDRINLGSGHLRGQISTEALKHRNCINLGAAKTRTSPTPTAQANDTAFPSSIKSTICKQVFYPVHFRSSKGYNYFIRNTLRERSPHVRRQVGGTPEHPRR